MCGASLFLLMISVGLFGQSTLPAKGMKEIVCEIVPVGPLSKSHLANYGSEANVLPLMSSLSAKSLNWSGYASFTSPTAPKVGSVTGVFGKWTVPKLRSSLSNRYSATWVGIDGFSNQTVEQIGTLQWWNNGHQENYAWFECYPASAYEIKGFPVKPHDIIKALVTYAGNDTFEMVLKNLTRHVFVRVPMNMTVASGAERASAEWIVEAPSSDVLLPLAHFTPITFKGCLATIGGVTRTIDSRRWKNSRITMVTDGTEQKTKAKPSHLSRDGKSFVVTWHHE